MGEEVEITVGLTGPAIREFLLQCVEGSPNGFYRAFRKVKPSTSYDSCRRYFYICKRLGLIEPTRRELGRGPIPRQLYRIVPGMENAEEWAHPQVSLYPATRLGRRRYRRWVERGKP